MMATLAIVTIRTARADETPALETLIADSARALGKGFYSDAETEAAILHIFGVDSELVADGSYFVAEIDGLLAGCGGWSRRRTLFGGDRFGARASGVLDPLVDAARIRAFFVAPGYARRGVGRALLAASEGAASSAGFARAELMATLPGMPFYEASGYAATTPITYDCGGVPVRLVPMAKRIDPQRLKEFDLKR